MYYLFNQPLFGLPFGLPFGSPFGLPFATLSARRRTPYSLIDRSGIPIVCTTGLSEGTSDTQTADYGINPCVWRALPNQTTILWKVNHPISNTGSSLPVTVVVPTAKSASTVPTNGSSSGVSKIPVVDNKSTQVVGSDVTVATGSGCASTQQSYTTEHIVYIDKCAGIFRLLGVQAASSPSQANTVNNAVNGGNDNAILNAKK